MSAEPTNQPAEGESGPGTLFKLPAEGPGGPPAPAGPPRMRRPDRHQGVMRPASLDELLAEDHPARLVWEYVAGLDMGPLYQRIGFSVEHGEFLDGLLTGSVAALLHQGLVQLERVAQDGVRVRASAGAASFRRRGTLEECPAEAAEQVETLRKELEADPSAASKRQKAARRLERWFTLRCPNPRGTRIGIAISRCQGRARRWPSGVGG